MLSPLRHWKLCCKYIEKQTFNTENRVPTHTSNPTVTLYSAHHEKFESVFCNIYFLIFHNLFVVLHIEIIDLEYKIILEVK